MKTLKLDGVTIPIIKWRVTNVPKNETVSWRFITVDGRVLIVESIQLNQSVTWVDDDCSEITIDSTLSPVRDLIVAVLGNSERNKEVVTNSAITTIEQFVRRFFGRYLVGLPEYGSEQEWNIDRKVIDEKWQQVRTGAIISREILEALVVMIRRSYKAGVRPTHAECAKFVWHLKRQLLGDYPGIILESTVTGYIKAASVPDDWLVVMYGDWMKTHLISDSIPLNAEETEDYHCFLAHEVNYIASFQSKWHNRKLPIKWVASEPTDMNEDDRAIFESYVKEPVRLSKALSKIRADRVEVGQQSLETGGTSTAGYGLKGRPEPLSYAIEFTGAIYNIYCNKINFSAANSSGMKYITYFLRHPRVKPDARDLYTQVMGVLPVAQKAEPPEEEFKGGGERKGKGYDRETAQQNRDNLLKRKNVLTNKTQLNPSEEIELTEIEDEIEKQTSIARGRTLAYKDEGTVKKETIKREINRALKALAGKQLTGSAAQARDEFVKHVRLRLMQNFMKSFAYEPEQDIVWR